MHLTWDNSITVQHKNELLKSFENGLTHQMTKLQVDVAGYLFIPQQKDTIGTYLKVLAVNLQLVQSHQQLIKQIMYLRLNMDLHITIMRINIPVAELEIFKSGSQYCRKGGLCQSCFSASLYNQ